jgi:hypothetical protein
MSYSYAEMVMGQESETHLFRRVLGGCCATNRVCESRGAHSHKLQLDQAAAVRAVDGSMGIVSAEVMVGKAKLTV